MRVDGVAVLDGVPTGVALIVVDAAGENQIAVGAGANAGVERDRVRAALVDALPHTDCVLVSTEIPLAAVVVAVETATAVGVPCVLNPAPVLPGLAGLLVPRPGLRGPLLTPNVGELAALTGPGPTGVRAVGLAARTEAPVVVTLGGEGALVVEPGGGRAPAAAPDHGVRHHRRGRHVQRRARRAARCRCRAARRRTGRERRRGAVGGATSGRGPGCRPRR